MKPDYHLKRNIEDYMSNLDTSEVRSLRELVDFINDHAKQELPPGE